MKVEAEEILMSFCHVFVIVYGRIPQKEVLDMLR